MNIGELLGPDLPEVVCVCGRAMELRPSKHGRFWCCVGYPVCTGRHGAHQKTGLPLGTPTDEAGMAARRRAHAAFDPLWKTKEMTRGEAYEWLTREVGKAHIGDMNVDECARVVRACLQRTFRGSK